MYLNVRSLSSGVHGARVWSCAGSALTARESCARRKVLPERNTRLLAGQARERGCPCECDPASCSYRHPPLGVVGFLLKDQNRLDCPDAVRRNGSKGYRVVEDLPNAEPDLLRLMGSGQTLDLRDHQNGGVGPRTPGGVDLRRVERLCNGRHEHRNKERQCLLMGCGPDVQAGQVEIESRRVMLRRTEEVEGHEPGPWRLGGEAQLDDAGRDCA